MLKIIGLFDKLASGKNISSRLVSSRNNNSKPVFRKNDSNSKVDRFDVSKNNMKDAKRSGKSKNKKISKSQNLAKLRKKLSKMRIYLILMLQRLNQNS